MKIKNKYKKPLAVASQRPIFGKIQKPTVQTANVKAFATRSHFWVFVFESFEPKRERCFILAIKIDAVLKHSKTSKGAHRKYMGTHFEGLSLKKY